ncbi:MAG: hypothetical protein IPH04_14460 [Saprospirales bacterium]|nr:hypothetical protein [Saprospirales bacterium]
MYINLIPLLLIIAFIFTLLGIMIGTRLTYDRIERVRTYLELASGLAVIWLILSIRQG